MVVLSVMYPYGEDATFDMDYYASTHMAMVRELFEPMGMRHARLYRGLTEGAPGQPAYFAIAALEFDDLPSLMGALGAHGAQMQADLVNFTTAKPVTQFSEVVSLG
jgi:uncharacterized protein (TIGR02118 family)